MHEVWYKIESSEYSEGFFLQEYKENFFLVAGGEGREGTNYKKWVFAQTKDKQPAIKAIPMSVKLGTRREAIEILKKVLGELSNNAT